MDRRQFSGQRGSVIVGALPSRPAAGSPGRVYITPDVFMATAASGARFPIVTIDGGSAWSGGPAQVFRFNRNAALLTFTASGIQKSLIAFGVTSTGTRVKPQLQGGVLGTGRKVEAVFEGVLNCTGTRTLGVRGKYGAVTLVSATITVTGTAAGAPGRARISFGIFNRTATIIIGRIMAENQLNKVAAANGSTAAVSPSASQLFDLTLTATGTGLTVSIDRVYVTWNG